jgi:hypothetical protein
MSEPALMGGFCTSEFMSAVKVNGNKLIHA